MTTTREKFRARRAARFWKGQHWKPNQIRRTDQQATPPLVINMIPAAARDMASAIELAREFNLLRQRILRSKGLI